MNIAVGHVRFRSSSPLSLGSKVLGAPRGARSVRRDRAVSGCSRSFVVRDHCSVDWKRAGRLLRELWKQPVVTGVFVGSLVFVACRTALLSVHELFPGGARIGEVVFELALAYVAAWMFNLLVVVLPQLRSRDRVLAAVGRVISKLADVGLQMPTALAQGAQISAPGQTVPIEEWLTKTGKRLSLAGPSPLLAPDGVRMTPATWQEWVSDAVTRVESLNTSLVPYLPFLEIELIGLVNDVVLSDFVDEGRAIAGLTRPALGDMGSLAHSLRAFMAACAALREYGMREFPQGDVLAGPGRHDATL